MLRRLTESLRQPGGSLLFGKSRKFRIFRKFRRIGYSGISGKSGNGGDSGGTGGPGMSGGAFFHDFRSIFGPIFVVFRGYFANRVDSHEEGCFRAIFFTISPDFACESQKPRENVKIAPLRGLATKSQGNCKVGPSRCASARLRDGTAKSDENQGEKRPEILEKPF